jgi:hypothetical protein
MVRNGAQSKPSSGQVVAINGDATESVGSANRPAKSEHSVASPFMATGGTDDHVRNCHPGENMVDSVAKRNPSSRFSHREIAAELLTKRPAGP